MSEACRRLMRACVVIGVTSMPCTSRLLAQCQLPKLTASDAEEADEFGAGVDVSGDFAAIGARFDDEGASPDAGAVYVYRRQGVFWEHDARLVTEDPDAGDRFGGSVAIDGDVLIAGASRDDEGVIFNGGAAYIFTRDETGWTQTIKLQKPGGPVASDFFGFDVDVEGSVAIVGAYFDDIAGPGDSGAAYVFRRQGGVWTHEQTLTASDAAAGNRFGVSVAIDGNTAVVGAYWTNDAGVHSGSAYIYTFQGGSWNETIKLRAGDEAAGDEYGRSVGVSGTYAVIGSYLANIAGTGDVGAVYVYRNNGQVWGEEQKVTAMDGMLSDKFGRSVAIDGDTMLIGAVERDLMVDAEQIPDAGAAYVFRLDGAVWSQEQVLVADDPMEEDELGLAIGLDGGWGFVGTRKADLAGPLVDGGAVYTFWLDAEPDCNMNGVADVCDLASGNGQDCDNNAVPDSCEPDCDGNGQNDVCDLTGGATDCDGNGVLDACEPDCNGNGATDACDITGGTSPDCNNNLVPDECDVSGGGSEDCNGDGVPNECETDCDGNGSPDECEIAAGLPDCNGNGVLDVCEMDCNANGVPDDCDLAGGASDDCNLNDRPDECDVAPGGGSVNCNGNAVPDECEEDCNASGMPDDCDIANGTSIDCNGNGVPDECEKGAGQDCNLNTIPDECEPDCNGNNRPDDCDLATGTSADCNGNDLPDECDIAIGVSLDCDLNGVPDECDVDCNANNTPDACDIIGGDSEDCDANDVPDECDLDADPDCNGNGVLDTCETDCNDNAIPDDCDLTAATSLDCNNNDAPDECDIAEGFSVDCNANGVPDVCDVAGGASEDCNGDEIPDECASLPLVLESAPLSPIGVGVPQSFTIPGAPLAAGPVTVTLLARADLESPAETLEVRVNGTTIGTLFETSANDCPEVFDEDSAVVGPVLYNELIASGDAVFTVIASEAVDPDPVLCDPVLIIRVLYQELFNGDCNLNNMPDDCELASGLSPDCNENGVPDECDIVAGVSGDTDGGGIPDECQATGDGDGDGDVDLIDYKVFLFCAAGPGGGIVEPFCTLFDFDVDLDVDLVDFGTLQTFFTVP